MKKRIAILSALLLMTGCTGNVTSPVSQPSQSSQTSQTSQSEQSVTAPKESTPESSAQAEATAEHRARKYRGASGNHADRGASRNRNG